MSLYVCPLTLVPPTRPVTTPCAHTFELDSLEQYRTARSPQQPCPVCDRHLGDAELPCYGLAVNRAMREQMDETLRLRERVDRLAPEVLKPIVAADIVIENGWPIGSGADVVVRKATMGGAVVALKQIRVSGERAARDAAREIAVLQRLRHTHVVQLLGTTENAHAGELWLVLEFAEHGSIASLLGADRKAERRAAFGSAAVLPGPTSTFFSLAHQLACALTFLHKQLPHPVVHGDITGENVLVFPGGKVKLADFGLARVVGAVRPNTTTSGVRGTVRFMAPELLEADVYARQQSVEADVYALGCLLSTLLSGQQPFPQLLDHAIVRAVCDQHVLPELPAATPAFLRQLIGSCWLAAASDRPAAVRVAILLVAARRADAEYATLLARLHRERLALHANEVVQVFCKTLDGKTITFCVVPKLTTVLTFKALFEDAEGVPMDQLRLIFGGKQLEDDYTLDDLGVCHEASLHAVLRLRGDIGEWQPHEPWRESDLLLARAAAAGSLALSAPELESIAAELRLARLGPEQPRLSEDEASVQLHAPLLAASHCAALIAHVDAQRAARLEAPDSADAPQPRADFKLSLSRSELGAIIGDELLAALLRLLPLGDSLGRSRAEPSAKVSLVLRRREAVPGSAPELIALHTDHALAVVNVALNQEPDFQGGRLVYLLNGSLVCPPRPAGVAVAHTRAIVHGVSALESGVRYNLFCALYTTCGSPKS